MDQTGDITSTSTPHPEAAEPDEPLRIVVDWNRFDAARSSIQLTIPDEE
jgi:hypothetical protein